MQFQSMISQTIHILLGIDCNGDEVMVVEWRGRNYKFISYRYGTNNHKRFRHLSTWRWTGRPISVSKAPTPFPSNSLLQEIEVERKTVMKIFKGYLGHVGIKYMKRIGDVILS